MVLLMAVVLRAVILDMAAVQQVVMHTYLIHILVRTNMLLVLLKRQEVYGVATEVAILWQVPLIMAHLAKVVIQ